MTLIVHINNMLHKQPTAGNNIIHEANYMPEQDWVFTRFLKQNMIYPIIIRSYTTTYFQQNNKPGICRK